MLVVQWPSRIIGFPGKNQPYPCSHFCPRLLLVFSFLWECEMTIERIIMRARYINKVLFFPLAIGASHYYSHMDLSVFYLFSYRICAPKYSLLILLHLIPKIILNIDKIFNWFLVRGWMEFFFFSRKSIWRRADRPDDRSTRPLTVPPATAINK